MSVAILGPIAEGGFQPPFHYFKFPAAGFPSPVVDHLEHTSPSTSFWTFEHRISTWCASREAAWKVLEYSIVIWLRLSVHTREEARVTISI